MKKIMMAATMLLLNVQTNAQLAVSTQATNGQQSVHVSTSISGLSLGATTVHTVKISDNPSLTPTIQGRIDSFVATATTAVKNDTIAISVPYPGLYYVTDSVTQYDPSGAVISKAGAATTSGVCLTPLFLNPTLVISSPTSDSTSAGFIAVSSSGYDTGNLTVIVSYGDTVFANPDYTFPALVKTIVPILGTTVQTHKDSLFIVIGENMPFSYKVIISNSKKTVTSAIYKGRTRPKTTGIEILGTEKTASPGTVYIYSMTGAKVWSGHVNDIENMHDISSKVQIPGIYIATAFSETGMPIAPQKFGVK